VLRARMGNAPERRLRLDLYPSPELIEALDRLRAQTPGLPSRAEAARGLLEEGLKTRGLLPTPKKPKRTAG
jgi:hypothetical protein